MFFNEFSFLKTNLHLCLFGQLVKRPGCLFTQQSTFISSIFLQLTLNTWTLKHHLHFSHTKQVWRIVSLSHILCQRQSFIFLINLPISVWSFNNKDINLPQDTQISLYIYILSILFIFWALSFTVFRSKVKILNRCLHGCSSPLVGKYREHKRVGAGFYVSSIWKCTAHTFISVTCFQCTAGQQSIKISEIPANYSSQFISKHFRV